MTPEEFERLKEEEKQHLRQMRDLKQQYRGAQRKKSTLDALGGMRNADLEAETGRLTEDLQRGAALQDARLDLALEGHAPVTGNVDEVDKAVLAQAEAEALVRQMKAQMGELPTPDAAPNRAIDPVRTPNLVDPEGAHGTPKTIGRTPPPAGLDSSLEDQDAKTIGRRRDP